MNFKLFSVFGVLTMFLAACSPATEPTAQTEDGAASTSELTELEQPVSPDGEAGESEMAADYQIDMSNFEYSVTEMTASPGQTLVVNLTTTDGMHDLVIDELGVQSSILNTGESQLIEIVIPEDAAAGEYEYYCSVGNHRAMGMVGTLTIVE